MITFGAQVSDDVRHDTDEKQSQPLPPGRAVRLEAMALDGQRIASADSVRGTAMESFARDL